MSINLLTDIFRSKRALKIPPEIEQRFKEEELCRRCGLCCYGSVRYKGRLVIIKELPCKYLELDAGGKATCRIYPDRHQLAPWCQRVERKTVEAGLFPDDCPYVQGIEGYQGKVLLVGEEKKKFYRWLSENINPQPQPEYLEDEVWRNFLAKFGIYYNTRAQSE